MKNLCLLLIAIASGAVFACPAGWLETKGAYGVTCAAQREPLPHRTEGLDPQGHLPAGFNPHGPLCPGQYTYTDSDGFPIFCWGKK